jgi:predicted permease
MSLLRNMTSGFRSLFRKERVERELDEELRAYVEMATEEKMRQGMSHKEAARAVRLERGSLDATKEEVRTAAWESFVETCWRDLRFAIRTLRKSPGLAVVAVLSLALGIGANTAIFTLINALLLRNLPAPHPEQLVRLSLVRPDGQIPFSFPMFRELERGQRVFSDVIAWNPAGVFNVEANGTLARDTVNAVSGNYFSVLGTTSLLGRLITPTDANLGNDSSNQVAVLGYGFWQRRFGAARDVVGRQIRIEGHPFTIVGVTRRWFTGMSPGEPPEIIIPITAQPLLEGNSNILQTIEDRSILWLYVVGRLRDAITISQAKAQLESFWPSLLETTAPTQVPGIRRQRWLSMTLDVSLAARGVVEDLRAQFERPLYVLLAVAALILLVACVNLASLMLARAAIRSHEMSVRVALGAKRSALVRQVLSESLVLSFTGALLGLALAYWGSGFLVALMTRYYLAPVTFDLRPDLRVLALTVSIAVLTGVLFGLPPAWRSSRQDPMCVLRQNSRSLSGRASRFNKCLIVAQLTFSFVLLMGAGLLAQTFQRLHSADLGFNREGLLEVVLSPRPTGYRNLDMNTYHAQLAERICAIPGVRSASFSDDLLPSAEGWRDMVSILPAGSGGDGPMVITTIVSPGFFGTLGIRLVDGHDFAWNDDEQHPLVAIVSHNLAKRLFPNARAIDQRIRFGVIPDFQSLDIVGVADDARVFDLRNPAAYVLYVPSTQHPKWARWSNLFIRARSEPDVLAKTISHEVEALGHEYVVRARSVTEVTDELLIAERVTALLASLFAGLALLLACVGLYGLMSYTVTRRTCEIGIRTALGAQRRDIVVMVLREAVELALLGILFGIPLALGATRLIASMLYGLSSSDISTLAAVSFLLFAVALFAAYLPGRRATRVDPMIALRYE